MNDDLSKNSKLEYVRANSRIFLGAGKEPDLREFSGMLVVDALCLNCSPVNSDRFGDWYLVYSKQDWILAETDLKPLDAFHRLQKLPQHRANSCRANIILAAYCRELFTFGQDGLTVVKGSIETSLPVAKELQMALPGNRIVAFRGLE